MSEQGKDFAEIPPPPGTDLIIQQNIPQISPRAIQETKFTIAILQDMVKEVLTEGIDYGVVPGVKDPFLWDPGASMIIASFNCYPGERRLLAYEDTEEKIVVCIEVPLINRQTEKIMATGVGAASTMETKYKYRWVKNPQEWGYDEEAISSLKTKTGDGAKLYRITNPEHHELANTIVKIAAKRAEVDAAQTLPGVASVLRKMFTGYKPKNERSTGDDKWQWFWGETRRLGYTQPEVHKTLEVPSMKVWLDKKGTLEDAIGILTKKKMSAPGENNQERPFVKRNQLWSEIKNLINKEPVIPHSSIFDWFLAHYSIEVDSEMMGAPEPQDVLTDVMLQSLLDSLIAYRDKESKKGFV